MSNTKVKFELNSSGIIAVMQSQWMMDEMLKRAAEVGEIDSHYVAYDRAQVIVRQEKRDAD